MTFLGGLLAGQTLSAPVGDDKSEECIAWPFQVIFDFPLDFSDDEILISCTRHTYRLLLTGEQNDGSEWAQYSHESSYPVEVKTPNTKQGD